VPSLVIAVAVVHSIGHVELKFKVADKVKFRVPKELGRVELGATGTTEALHCTPRTPA